MPAALADSALFRPLFGDDETAALFTDSATIRAMLLVEGALARVQGQLGLIPETASAYIDRASYGGDYSTVIGQQEPGRAIALTMNYTF